MGGNRLNRFRDRRASGLATSMPLDSRCVFWPGDDLVAGGDERLAVAREFREDSLRWHPGADAPGREEGEGEMTSQNATFHGSVTPDAEYEHPAGLPIVRALGAELNARSWITGEFDNWRDCGWSIPCGRDGGEMQLVVAPASSADEWTLQIAPVRVPGPLGRALGRVPSASAVHCYELATEVHSVLSRQFARLRWRWDGSPDEEHSTPAPTRLDPTR